MKTVESCIFDEAALRASGLSVAEIRALNPGIVRFVALLRANDFDTCDSGDGETHDHECDRPYGYVASKVAPAMLVHETRRLRSVLAVAGVHVEQQSMDESKPAIQASYDPVSDVAMIDLMGVHDRMLERVRDGLADPSSSITNSAAKGCAT